MLIVNTFGPIYILSSSLYNLENVNSTQFVSYIDLLFSWKLNQLIFVDTEINNYEYVCAKKYTLTSRLYNLQNLSTAQFSFYVDLFLSLKIKQLMSKLVISHITVIIDTIPIKLAICFSFFYLWRQEHAWRNEIFRFHIQTNKILYMFW